MVSSLILYSNAATAVWLSIVLWTRFPNLIFCVGRGTRLGMVYQQLQCAQFGSTKLVHWYTVHWYTGTLVQFGISDEVLVWAVWADTRYPLLFPTALHRTPCLGLCARVVCWLSIPGCNRRRPLSPKTTAYWDPLWCPDVPSTGEHWQRHWF